MRWLRLLGFFVVCFGLTSVAHATTLQGPADAPGFELPEGWVACEQPSGGFSLENNGRLVKPPQGAPPGHEGQLKAAHAARGCGADAEVIYLLVTGALPEIDPASVILSLAAGQLEFSGKRLEGVRVEWGSAKARKSDTCNKVTPSQGHETCSIPVGKEHPTDPSVVRFTWVPPGGRAGKGVRTFDHQGSLTSSNERTFGPNQIVLGRVLQRARSVDVSTGVGQIEVVYPGAVSSVECDGANCELADGKVLVRSVPVSAQRIALRMTLLPRIVIARSGKLEGRIEREFDVVRCDMDVLSGKPLRDADDVKVLVRLPETCVGDAERHSWNINQEPVAVERVETSNGLVYVLLRAGRLLDDEITVVATRPQDESALALVSVRTRALPAVHTSLILPGFGEVDFIPKNHDVLVATGTVPGGRLVPIEVPGAYAVTTEAAESTIRGVYMSSGFTALRLAYRADGVPADFGQTNFATLTDPIQRPIREANLPIQLGASTMSSKPVIELRCALGPGSVQRIPPGVTQHIPFPERDSCRLVIHKARIPEDSGEQLVEIEVRVTTAGDVERSDARMQEKLLLRHAKETDVIWIQGAKQQFDRILVRVHHVVDEARYLLGHGRPYRLPTGQWTVVTEDASLKFYATATIPSGLFRFSDDPQDLGTGALALNFGVLSRLTLLSDEGKESLVGLEGGVMSLGLATEKDRQLAIVAGLGIGVPLGNINQPTQASLNIHAWLAYSLGKRTGRLLDEDGTPGEEVRLNPWALIFGPSITIGSLAAFL